MSTPYPNLKPVFVELRLDEVDLRGGAVAEMIASTARPRALSRRASTCTRQSSGAAAGNGWRRLDLELGQVHQHARVVGVSTEQTSADQHVVAAAVSWLPAVVRTFDQASMSRKATTFTPSGK